MKTDLIETVHDIRVDRLLSVWNPFRALHIHIVDLSRPISECGYTNIEQLRSTEYHIGRVKYFIRKILQNIPIDPIEIDNMCDEHGIHPEPILIDGNHRLGAHIITNKITIPTLYGGRVDVLNWLLGKRKTRPR